MIYLTNLVYTAKTYVESFDVFGTQKAIDEAIADLAKIIKSRGPYSDEKIFADIFRLYPSPQRFEYLERILPPAKDVSKMSKEELKEFDLYYEAKRNKEKRNEAKERAILNSERAIEEAEYAEKHGVEIIDDAESAKMSDVEVIRNNKPSNRKQLRSSQEEKRASEESKEPIRTNMNDMD